MEIIDQRYLDGRNVWNHGPVIQARLRLRVHEQISTHEISGFADRILVLLPGLIEHNCGRGHRGGFCERLAEGTYLAHVVEHATLELQTVSGFPVGYGKTVRVKGLELWDMVCQCGTPELGAAALGAAVELINTIVKGTTCPIGEILQRLKQIGNQSMIGPSTQSILDSCRARGIPVLPLVWGSVYQLGYGCHQRLIQATITSQTSALAVDLAGDKMLTKQLLASAGLPVPPGRLVSSQPEINQAIRELGYPVVIKPLHGNQGKGVSLNLNSPREAEAAFRIAHQYDKQIVVESHVQGKHYRLLVIGGRMVAAAQRLPAQVTGDGVHTINELIEASNKDPRRGVGHERPLTKLHLDPVALLELGRQGYQPDSRPEPGVAVLLRSNANISNGGMSIDVTDQVHPDNVGLVERAGRLSGLDTAGIDLVCGDISAPVTVSGGAIIEINAAPGFRMHLSPQTGEPREVGRALVDYLFPPGSPVSIPLVAVTGTNGKTTTARLLGHLFQQCGLSVGMATTGGIFINGRCSCTGDTTGPASARALLRDPAVEMAILETARGGILRGGLGYDLADVAVVTNMGPDHLGQDGIETMEDLFWVKSLVVEAVKRDGYVILNADDPYATKFASKASGQVVYFSLQQNNPIIRRHLGIGGCAVIVKEGVVYICQGDQDQRLIMIKSIRAGMGGRAVHNLANALAAAAAAFVGGLPPVLIRHGLYSFGAQQEDNPGRLMVRHLGKVTVIVDYGHNSPAFRCISDFARSFKPRRLIGVVGVPGDRGDEQIIAAGAVAGEVFDVLLIKEDLDRRGRKLGETARLLYRGAKSAGLSGASLKIVERETEAAETALLEARPGDLVVIFYELLDPVLALLDRVQAGQELAKYQHQTAAFN